MYYYGKLVYQDINMRSYFGSIRPPTRLTFGFRLGKCSILHFQKRTSINVFIPRRILLSDLKQEEQRKKKKKRPLLKGWWWDFRKLRPSERNNICSSGRNEVRGRRARKGVEPDRLNDQKNEVRVWPKKKQPYGYHDQSPSIRKNLSKSLRGSGAFKHPKYTEIVNNVAFLLEKNYSSKRTQLFKLFFQKKSRYNDPQSHLPKSSLLKRPLPAVRPSLNYSVMQYLLNTKNKMNFDPVPVLKHFVAPGVVDPSVLKRSNAQGRNLDKRIHSRIALFLESSTSEKESLAESKKRLTHFIRQENDLRFAGRKKPTISLFPFFGATFLFPRDGVRVYKNLPLKAVREQILGKLRRKCWNLIGKDKGMKLIEKLIDLGLLRELTKGVEMMVGIILKNRRIPYGYNSYLNEVTKMRSLLSNRTQTKTLIESTKIKSVYQSASLIAQDISFNLKLKKRIEFSSLFSQVVKKIPLVMKWRIEGIRICCSGRLQGAEIARTECGKYGKTSCNVLDQKRDYASALVSTRYGIVGVKVWISYRKQFW